MFVLHLQPICNRLPGVPCHDRIIHTAMQQNVERERKRKTEKKKEKWEEKISFKLVHLPCISAAQYRVCVLFNRLDARLCSISNRDYVLTC